MNSNGTPLIRYRDSSRVSSRSFSRGFSLVEMLVVIGVIVTLAAILTPVLLKGWNRAKSVAIRQNLIAIETALNAYKADFGSFPVTRLDNSIEGMPSANMDGWDVDINRSGFRGARLLCKALVGIGPQGGLESASYPSDPSNHVLGQDGLGDETEPNKKSAPGFRVSGRGGEVNSASRKYSPYLNLDAFRVAETQSTNTDYTFQLVSAYFPKNYTYNSTSGYTAQNPLGAGTIPAGYWDRFVIIDSTGRPILYYPVLNPSSDIRSDQDSTNNSGNFITLEETAVAARVSMFRATDNHAGTTLALPPAFPGLHADTFKLYMGDADLNGRINGQETPAITTGYVLWSAGPNLKYNTAKTIPDKRGEDDVTNLPQ